MTDNCDVIILADRSAECDRIAILSLLLGSLPYYHFIRVLSAAGTSDMKLTLQDRLLHRETGHQTRYGSINGLYGDRKWIGDLDIVNELGGHSGCVNALR